MKLTKNRIKEIAEKSNNYVDYLLNFYKEAIPNFSQCKKVNGFPEITKKTFDVILENVPASAHSDKSQFCLLWLNNGFTVTENNNSVNDFEVNMKHVNVVL